MARAQDGQLSCGPDAVRYSGENHRACDKVHFVICVASGGSLMNQSKRRSTYQYGTLMQESRRRGSDVWVYRYSQTINGKKSRRKRIVGTVQQYPTRAEAQRACEHVRMAANAETTTPESPSLGGLIDRYVEQILQPCLDVPLGGRQDEFSQISYHCAKSYKSALNRWVRPRWETYRVREFEQPAVRAAIEDWLKSLWRSPRNPQGLAPKTVRSIYNVMKLSFKFGVKWGYLRENPMAEKRVELPRGSTKRTKQPVQLTPVWFFLLLTKLPLREKLAVAFSGWLGPRISEAFGLQWQDLDLDEGSRCLARYSRRDTLSILLGPLSDIRPAVLTLSPLASYSGGIESGCNTIIGTLVQSIATLLRTACVYPSTRGNRISYRPLSGIAWT